MLSPDAAHSTPEPAPTALYIHWPFCKKKCPYCDFNSHVRERVDQDAWRDALLREMGHWHACADGTRLTSIFFGGGTPSLMHPDTAAALIAEAKRLWPHNAGLEVTLEANPTSVEAANFTALRGAGVNRLSLGIQSLRPEALAFLGREHSAEEARAAIDLAASIFPRHSFDLIYALPGQTPDAWEAELRAALPLANGHLSLYQLTIEENTAFHHAYHVAKSFALPDEDTAAEFYARTQMVMEEAGLPAYEISNHAAPGQESRHNLAYWQSIPYIGLGPGAHGRVDLGEARIATRNLKSPERWLESVQNRGHGLEEETALTTQDRVEETVLMGLRLKEGIPLTGLPTPVAAGLAAILLGAPCHHLKALGFLEQSTTRLRATPQGMPLLNRLIEQLLTPQPHQK